MLIDKVVLKKEILKLNRSTVQIVFLDKIDVGLDAQHGGQRPPEIHSIMEFACPECFTKKGDFRKHIWEGITDLALSSAVGSYTVEGN